MYLVSHIDSTRLVFRVTTDDFVSFETRDTEPRDARHFLDEGQK